MADIRIKNLPTQTALNGLDVVATDDVSTDTTKKITLTQIKTLVNADSTMTGTFKSNVPLDMNSNAVQNILYAYIQNSIVHDGDTDTKIEFSLDRIKLEAGGKTFIDIWENLADDTITFGDGTDVNYQFKTTNDDNTLFIDGGTDKVGIGTNTPLTKLDIHHTPTALADDTGGGEVVLFGAGNTVAGALYYLNTAGVWVGTDANSGSSTGNVQMLAIALGTDPAKDGMLIRGFFDLKSYIDGTFTMGVALYVSTTLSFMATAAPSASGNFVRVIGHCTDTANVIYFNPSSTYVLI